MGFIWEVFFESFIQTFYVVHLMHPSLQDKHE